MRRTRFLLGALGLAVIVTAVSAALMTRVSAIELARWLAPATVDVKDLSGVSVGWRGGEVKRVEVVSPGGHLIAHDIMWHWVPRLSLEHPITLVSASLSNLGWRVSPDTSSVSDDAPEMPLQLTDFRQSSWWPAVRGATLYAARLEVQLEDQAITLLMDAPISSQQGHVVVRSQDDRLEFAWEQRAPAEWRGTASVTGAMPLSSSWVMIDNAGHFTISGDIQSPGIPVSGSQWSADVHPFLDGQPNAALMIFTTEAMLHLPSPLLGRSLTIEASGEIDTVGAGTLKMITSDYASPSQDEWLAIDAEVVWEASFSNPEATLNQGEMRLREIDLDGTQLNEFSTRIFGTWDIEAASGQLETGELQALISSSGWQAALSSSGFLAEGALDESRLSGSLQIAPVLEDQPLPVVDAIVSLALDDARVAADIEGFAPWGALGKVRLAAPLAGAATRFSATLNTALWDWPMMVTSLTSLFPEMAELEVTSLSSRVELTGELSEQGVAADVQGQISDGYFSFGTVGVADLDVAPFALRFDDIGLRPVDAVNFTVAAVNAGVPVSDMMGRLSRDEAGWVLAHAEGAALGGQLVIDQFRDFSRDGPLGTVYFNDIDLAAVVDVAGTQGVEIQGRANASLPLRWQSGAVLIDAGRLSGTPGVLKYQPDMDPAQIDQRVGAVAAALSNLQFEELDADITLDEAGVMFFRTSVLGSNPDYQAGRQVKLNLTLENNLLSLMQSLQTIDSVNVWVTRQFEQQQ